MKQVANIDEYIKDFPKDVQLLLSQIRNVIKKAAPQAEEAIKYAMPTFILHGNVVHFAAYKNHIGFYPAPSGLIAFESEIKKYKHSKGAVQFPLDKKLPIDLITQIVKFRVAENLTKAETKRHLKVCKEGHQFYKSSDCPVCPICEKANKPQNHWLHGLSAPARRGLENEGISTVKQLAKFTKKEILALHGIGKTALPILDKILEQNGLSFKK